MDRPDEEAPRHDRIEERLDEQAGSERRIGRSPDAVLQEIELHEIAATSGRDGVHADPGEVGAEDVAIPDASVGIGRAQDVLPRAHPEDELQEMQRDREDERRPRHGREMAEEGLARVDERLDIVHAPTIPGRPGWLPGVISLSILTTGFEAVSPP